MGDGYAPLPASHWLQTCLHGGESLLNTVGCALPAKADPSSALLVALIPHCCTANSLVGGLVKRLCGLLNAESIALVYYTVLFKWNMAHAAVGNPFIPPAMSCRLKPDVQAVIPCKEPKLASSMLKPCTLSVFHVQVYSNTTLFKSMCEAKL